MRFDRLIVLSLLVWACKPTQVVTSSVYREDLSVHRLTFDPAQIVDTSDDETEIEDNSDAPYLPNAITEELDSVNQLIIAANKKRKYWDGYVIQVYRGDSRSDAYQIKNTIQETFPELAPQVSYYQPTYRVKAGQYFDRLEATRKHQEVIKLYPRALLLPEKLPLPTQDGDN